MTQLLLPLLIALLTFGSLHAQKAKSKTILFDYDKYLLTPTAIAQLDELILFIQDKNLVSISLQGHTDGDGSNAYNDTLAANRVKTVRSFLSAKGVQTEKMQSASYGEEKPLATNSTKEGMQANRRVELLIRYDEHSPTAVVEKPVEPEKKLVIGDIFTMLTKPPQQYTASANDEIRITGKKGTQIKIPANALVTRSGKIEQGKVKIELKEYYSMSDILMGNMHTISGKRMLETAGMIYIQATNSSGDTLQLRPDSSVQVQFTRKRADDNMSIYTGVEHGEEIDWIKQDSGSGEGIRLFADDPPWNAGETEKEREERRKRNMYRALHDSNSLKSINKKKIAENMKVNKLILTSTTLGFINCDRLLYTPNPTDMQVVVDTALMPVVRLVFKNIYSILPGQYNRSNRVEFYKLPVGQRATLVAVSLVNNTPYYAAKEIIIRKNHVETIKMSPTTLAALKMDLKNLDSARPMGSN